MPTSLPQEMCSRALAVQHLPSGLTPPPSSTLLHQRSSQPVGVQNRLNPTAGDSAGAHGRLRNAELLESSPQTASIGSRSRPAPPSVPTTSVTTSSLAENSLPSIRRLLTSVYPQSLGHSMTPQSPSISPRAAGVPSATTVARRPLPRDHANMSSGFAPVAPADLGMGIPPHPYLSALPQSRSPPFGQGSRENVSYRRVSGALDRPSLPVTGPPVSQSRSASQDKKNPSCGQIPTLTAGAPPGAAAGQPQSLFQGPFASSDPARPTPQGCFDQKAYDATASAAVGQTKYRLMTLETDHGPSQVPVDVQAASKVADEKRKRNATASHRFRQRRKAREQKASKDIAKLEAKIREITEEKDFYQRERDYFRDALRNRTPVTARPPSPRRRKHSALGGSSLAHSEESGATNRIGRNIRQRTNAYTPP